MTEKLIKDVSVLGVSVVLPNDKSFGRYAGRMTELFVSDSEVSVYGTNVAFTGYAAEWIMDLVKPNPAIKNLESG